MNGAAGECLQLLAASGGSKQRPLTGEVDVDVTDSDSVRGMGDHNLNLNYNKNEGKPQQHFISYQRKAYEALSSLFSACT